MNNFGAMLYEWIVYDPVYSGHMFTNGHYAGPALAVILIPLLAAVVFYYIWNPLYGDWQQWLLSIAGGMVVSGIVVYSLLNNYLAKFLVNSKEYPNAGGYQWEFTLWSLLLALIAGIIWSFIVKWKSSKNKYQPL